MSVYVDEDNGLKIKMKAGGLGDLIVYIKSNELITYEKEEKERNGKPIEASMNDLTIRDDDEEDDEGEIKKVPSKRVSKKTK